MILILYAPTASSLLAARICQSQKVAAD